MSAFFQINADTIAILVTASLVASACALVGSFLVLRRLAMLGDAISHAVLPGIVLAFLFTGSRNILPMLVGAAAMGLLTVLITDTLNRYGKLQSDASMGVTFTWLFALGVILVTRYTGQVDLDVECVLYGDILYAPFDSLYLYGHNVGPRSAWLLGTVTLANGAFIVLGYKQLKITTFDPALAAALGISTALWHYLLMTAVSVTTVASFESVGAILVVAMLTIPPNAAYMLTDRLPVMIVLSVVIAVLSAVLGYALAWYLDAAIAAAIAVVAGIIYGLAALLSPRNGIVAQALRARTPLLPPV